MDTDGGGGWLYSNGALFSLGENLSPLLRNCIVGNGRVICVPILAKSLYSPLDFPPWSNKLEFHKSNTIHKDAWCTVAPEQEPLE